MAFHTYPCELFINHYSDKMSQFLYPHSILHYLHTPRLDQLSSASSPFPLNPAPFAFIYPYTYIIYIFLHPYTNIPLFPYHLLPFQSGIWHLILYLASSTLYLASGIWHPLWYLASSILYLTSGIWHPLWYLASSYTWHFIPSLATDINNSLNLVLKFTTPHPPNFSHTKNQNYLLISPICCDPPSGFTVGKTLPAMLDRKGQLTHNYWIFV